VPLFSLQSFSLSPLPIWNAVRFGPGRSSSVFEPQDRRPDCGPVPEILRTADGTTARLDQRPVLGPVLDQTAETLPMTNTFPPNLVACHKIIRITSASIPYPSHSCTSTSTYEDPRMDTALHPRTLQTQRDRHPRRLPHIPRNLLRALAPLHQHRPHPRHQGLRELQPALHHIANNNRLRPCRPRTQQRDKADGSSAGDEDRVPEPEVGAVDPGEGDGERLAEGAFFEGDGVGEAV
jgi:hypothetical protein